MVGGAQYPKYNAVWTTFIYDLANNLWHLRCKIFHWNAVMDSSKQLERINTLCKEFENLMDSEVRLRKARIAREEANRKRKLKVLHINNQTKVIKCSFTY
jgi:hypothetical protein